MAERLPTLGNPRSDRFRQVASLGRRSFRTRKQLLRVEGPQAVTELLLHRASTIHDVYFTRRAADAYPQLWQLATDRVRWTHLVEEEVATYAAPDAQGIFAVSSLEAIYTEVFIGADHAPLVVLPGIQDPGNLGTIIRNADAFGAAGVIVCSGSVDVTSPKVIRATVGSIFHIPVRWALGFVEVVSELQRQGRTLYGTSGADESVPIGAANLLVPHAFIFGNEAAGLTEAEASACDQLVSVPMSGGAESLNVAVAAGICLFMSQQENLGERCC